MQNSFPRFTFLKLPTDRSAERGRSAEREDFKKLTFLNRKRSSFVKTHENRANFASGPRKSDSTRREDSDSVNESSVAALGASLVTKQAGRVPQHD